MFFTRVLNLYKFFNVSLRYVKHKLNSFVLGNKSFNMSDNLLNPPEHVRGIKELDKTMFTKAIKVPCVTVNSSSENVSSIIKHFKKYFLKLEHFKPIKTERKNDLFETCIYLCPKKIKTWSDIESNDRSSFETVNVNEENFAGDKDITLEYENYSLTSLLRAILPPDEEGMASFTKVGHIVHLNLREHLLPYKKVIGEVLLEKVAGCKSVVNKVNIIDNTYRNFQMEVLCGENNMMTKVKENKCLFEFNFATVYWNSRLSSEHERIVNIVNEGDVLFDVFAGVGPFAIPAAKRKSIVYANDLNPESFNWLNHNLKINKIEKKYLTTYNKDGRDFILHEIKENLIKYVNFHKVHITMNLPAKAVEFLPYFHKLYTSAEVKELNNPPLIYLYCFTKGEDYVQLAKALVIENMGFDIGDKILDIFKVRTVSSFKEMVRVTIKLDKDILTGIENNSIGCKRKMEGSNAIADDNGEPWEKIKNCTKPSK